MALNATAVKLKLSSASWGRRDDEAMNIINAASAAELKSLDAESVLRLHDAIRGGLAFYSSGEEAAIKWLAKETQFQPVKTPDFAVGLIKTARPGQPVIQSELSADLVNRIYGAENRRLSNWEKVGIDGDTIGRGQLGQDAFTDVNSPKYFKAEFEKCVNHDYLSRILSAPLNRQPYEANQFDGSTYKFRIPTSYSMIYRNPVLEDFVVTAYLAIMIEKSTKAGRSPKDAARFAVARYHGMFNMVSAAQTAISDAVNWSPVETHLRSQGKTDECDYVNEVVI